MEEEVRIIDTDVKEESPIEVIEEIIEEKVEKLETPIVEAPKLPENIDKLVKFMEETGGTVEDYVELNKDYSKLNNDQLLQEYLRKTKPPPPASAQVRPPVFELCFCKYCPLVPALEICKLSSSTLSELICSKSMLPAT